MARCPYCESTRSLLVGQVFCSRHADADMRALQSGTLYIRTRRLEECADHVSRLSVRLMLNGRQWYRVGGADRVVHAENFLVLDQGQHYRTAFSGEHEQEMLMVGFKPGLAAEALRTRTATAEQLLDDPWQCGPDPLFGDALHRMNDTVSRLFARLHALVHAPAQAVEPTEAEELHDRLLEHLLDLRAGERAAADRLPALRATTRRELWRRLTIARDHAHAHLHDPLTVAQLARVACLSEHHFKRLFRQAFGRPPHAYLHALRMDRARQLLLGTDLPVHAVTAAVGLVDTSSFVRSYRQYHGRTPGMERHGAHHLDRHEAGRE